MKMPKKDRKKQIDDQFREKIVAKFESGKSVKLISQELELNYHSVNSIIRVYKSTRRIQSIKKRLPKTKKITAEIEKFIKEKIEVDVSVTLRQLKNDILIEKDIQLSMSTINRAIKEFNYTFKKVSLIPERRNAEQNVEKRFEYAKKYILLDESKVIFFDEFGVNCSMRKSHGRSEKGITPEKVVRSIRSKNFSISAVMTKAAILYYKKINGSFNGERYEQFLRDFCETLRNENMNIYTFIMDNCSIHKVFGVQGVVEEYGHVLMFLPPYSPQLNPIEELFSKWKSVVRSANSTNAMELDNAVEKGCRAIISEDCSAFFSHMRKYVLQAIRKEPF